MKTWMWGAALPLLCLAACTAPVNAGREEYSEGMRRLKYDPGAAGMSFSAAEKHLALALSESDLELGEQVMAVTVRARCLMELERYTEVPALLAIPLAGYDPSKMWRGDLIGLEVLKASRLDPERGYAQLLIAERKAATLRSRVYLAWEQVHLLQKIGTPKAKGEAVKICEAHAGKIDFDLLRKQVSE